MLQLLPFSELLQENQQEEGQKYPSPRLGLSILEKLIKSNGMIQNSFQTPLCMAIILNCANFLL